MDKRSAHPIRIRFKNHQEMVDLTIKMELKYFMLKLLYAHRTRAV